MVLVKTFDSLCSPEYPSVSYSPKFVPRSPSVIDIDLEDNDIFVCGSLDTAQDDQIDENIQNNESLDLDVTKEENVNQEVINEDDDPSKNNDQSQEDDFFGDSEGIPETPGVNEDIGEIVNNINADEAHENLNHNEMEEEDDYPETRPVE